MNRRSVLAWLLSFPLVRFFRNGDSDEAIDAENQAMVERMMPKLRKRADERLQIVLKARIREINSLIYMRLEEYQRTKSPLCLDLVIRLILQKSEAEKLWLRELRRERRRRRIAAESSYRRLTEWSLLAEKRMDAISRQALESFRSSKA